MERGPLTDSSVGVRHIQVEEVRQCFMFDGTEELSGKTKCLEVDFMLDITRLMAVLKGSACSIRS